MYFELRCLIWEGDWSPDIVTVAAARGRRGLYGKIVLTVCGETCDQPQDKSSVFSSTLVQRTFRMPEQHDTTDLSCTLPQNAGNETITTNSSQLLADSVCSDAECESTIEDKPRVWPTDKTPRRTVISKRGCLTWSTEDAESLAEDADQPSSPKKIRLSRMNSMEKMTLQIKNDNREGQKT
ncbi:hypothetical protein F7725_007975 [Dissostichus mawsoni]|uniref:Uncharacterized protein n=1 Tax=Dissostichus mawsoni TaxID=36200 RepID=A0A7J5Y5V5_DISMA|nr:hypothetical protein F7725_007975 [Dissostichus mawsoni]